MGFNLDVGSLKDFKGIQEAFKSVKRYLDGDILRRGNWTFFEIPVNTAGMLQYKHHLGFKPRDVILLSVSQGVTVTWLYDSFTEEHLVLTASGACTIRAYIGAHREGNNVT